MPSTEHPEFQWLITPDSVVELIDLAYNAGVNKHPHESLDLYLYMYGHAHPVNPVKDDNGKTVSWVET